MAKFIAFSGKKQCGKDTAATIVYNILNRVELPLDGGPVALYKHSSLAGYKCRPFHFAKPLKDMVANVFGIDPKLIWGTDEDKETPTHIFWEGFSPEIRLRYSNREMKSDDYPYGNLPAPRSGPMTIRELLQIMGTDIFREQVYGEVWSEAPFRQPWGDENVVLMPDCRFPNEAFAVEDHDGLLIRINRTRPTEMNADQHASETSLDDFPFDYVYQNDGTLDDLESWLIGLLMDKGFLSIGGKR
jgi:hypothetical protein